MRGCGSTPAGACSPPRSQAPPRTPSKGRQGNIKTRLTLPVLRAACVALALAAAGTTAAAQPDAGRAPAAIPGALDINVYGFAYHPERDTVQRLGLDNEFNPGLGLHYELFPARRGVTFVEAGAYYDSGSHWAKFVALGYQFRIGRRLRIGGALALMHSDTYNDGAGFVGMIPLVTYDLGRIKLNAVYFPKFGKFNEVDAFGFYVSIPLAPLLP